VTLETLLSALALVMVIEGLMPLLGPRQWRSVFERVLAMQDGQIRFIGLASVLSGLLLLLLFVG
jgi:uncharacterized protein YjeT (DUF2065 family)